MPARSCAALRIVVGALLRRTLPAMHAAETMITTALQVAIVLRRLLGLHADFLVAPKVLAVALGLDPIGVSGAERVGLFGVTLCFDDTLDPELQGYQIGRAACAYALHAMGLIGVVSPHDLVAEMCGVGLPALAQVVEL